MHIDITMITAIGTVLKLGPVVCVYHTCINLSEITLPSLRLPELCV